jgi:cyclase
VLKKRLIFTLLYRDGDFCLSRNFRLQKIGNVSWLLNSYNFNKLAGVIDELVILDLSIKETNKRRFLNDVSEVIQDFFVPVSLGGNINSLKDAKMMFSGGADKLVINSLFYVNERICKDVVEKFGSQALVASIDFKLVPYKGDTAWSYQTYYGKERRLGLRLRDQLKNVQLAGCGEILLRSIDQDGTSSGLDLKSLRDVSDELSVPLIFAGGIGKPNHILEGLLEDKINGIATANLLNFVGDGFQRAKTFLAENGVNVTQNAPSFLETPKF